MVQLSQGAPTSVHLGAIWIDQDSLQSLCPAMAVLRGVCHMQSQSIWGLYHLNPHCFISDSTKVFNFLDYIWDWTFWILWRLNSLHSLVGMSPAFCWFESLLRSLSAEKKICHCFHFFPFYLPWSNEARCHNLHFLNDEFQASFFIVLFTMDTEYTLFAYSLNMQWKYECFGYI